jgi:hypothetical protein
VLSSISHDAIGLHSFLQGNLLSYLSSPAHNLSIYIYIYILKKESSNTKSLVYTSLVRPIPEYAASCWDPYKEGQKTELDRVQNKAAEFAHQMNDSKWETLVQYRNMARTCALFKAYTEERAWKAVNDRMQKPC